MKAAIFTPYLDTLGGGERYMLSIARSLLEEGHRVDIETKDKELIKRAEDRFGFSLKGLNAVESINRGSGYDLCVWLSDGSIPTLHSRKNILHFQRPFVDVDGKSLLNRMKFFRIHKVIVNSKFTKEYIDKEFPVKSEVLYPPVDVSKFKKGNKKRNVLYVGRFSQLEQAKRQDTVLTAFLKFYPYIKDEWTLTLAGGSDVGRTDEVDVLKAHAKKQPVEILENPSFSELKKLYSESTFFWSASGYGVNPSKEPNRMEHFGMAPVEAMAAGCIPILFKGGGHLEIVQDGVNGLLWENPKDMIFFTKKLIQDKSLMNSMSQNAIERSKDFSYENFKQNFLSII